MAGWSGKILTADKLHTLFRSIVDAEWNITSSLHTRLTDWDIEFFDEDEIEHSILSRCVLPPSYQRGPFPRNSDALSSIRSTILTLVGPAELITIREQTAPI